MLPAIKNNEASEMFFPPDALLSPQGISLQVTATSCPKVIAKHQVVRKCM